MSTKKCPDWKILNILTNRCVKIDGNIGKKILKNLTINKETQK